MQFACVCMSDVSLLCICHVWMMSLFFACAMCKWYLHFLFFQTVCLSLSYFSAWNCRMWSNHQGLLLHKYEWWCQLLLACVCAVHSFILYFLLPMPCVYVISVLVAESISFLVCDMSFHVIYPSLAVHSSLFACVCLFCMCVLSSLFLLCTCCVLSMFRCPLHLHTLASTFQP